MFDVLIFVPLNKRKNRTLYGNIVRTKTHTYTHTSCSRLLAEEHHTFLRKKTMRVYRAEKSIRSDSHVNDSSGNPPMMASMIENDYGRHCVRQYSCHQIDGTVAITKTIRTSTPFHSHYVWLITMGSAAVAATVLTSSSACSYYCVVLRSETF